MTTISVLIPTWRRPDDLRRCLLALGRQDRPADQVVVTVRGDDAETLALLDALSGDAAARAVERVIVEPGPLTAAMNAGLARTTGDLVALTDDDAEPRPDWLAKLELYFDDATIGGVGGLDVQPNGPPPVYGKRSVGCLSWYGRLSGNHHRGAGPARDVDVLKGVNCCFRGDELRGLGLDRRLRGKANVSHWEVSLCLTLRRRGWRLVYDPAIVVDHQVGTRHDGDVNARGGFAAAPYVDAVHNQTLSVLDHLPRCHRAAFWLWAFLVGTQSEPGLVQAIRRIWWLGDSVRSFATRLHSVDRGRRLARSTFRT